MEIDWLAPARLDDLLAVSVHSVEAGGAKLSFAQDMRRSDDDVLLATASVTAVCLDAKSFKPARMPAWIRMEIKHVE
jgi:acyl-CoA thioester hydrolase